MAISGAGRAELLCRRDRGGYPTVAVIRSAFAGGACKRGQLHGDGPLPRWFACPCRRDSTSASTNGLVRARARVRHVRIGVASKKFWASCA